MLKINTMLKGNSWTNVLPFSNIHNGLFILLILLWISRKQPIVALLSSEAEHTDDPSNFCEMTVTD